MVACMVAFLLSKTILEILLKMGFVKVVSYILSLYETDGNVFFKAKFLITLFEIFIFKRELKLLALLHLCFFFLDTSNLYRYFLFLRLFRYFFSF